MKLLLHAEILPILLALCLMLFHVYCTQNYAGIIDTSLQFTHNYAFLQLFWQLIVFLADIQHFT